MELRITGTDLPGRNCGDGDTNVHVGIQIRRDPAQVVPADAATVTFTTEIELVDRDGTVDFKGPAVQGHPGSRYVYLTWGNLGDDGDFDLSEGARTSGYIGAGVALLLAVLFCVSAACVSRKRRGNRIPEG